MIRIDSRSTIAFLIAVTSSLIPLAAFSQNCRNNAACSPSEVNRILYVDGVIYPTLHAAIVACPLIGCVIYDNKAETFKSNPFPGPGISKAVTVHFGPGIWHTAVTIILNGGSRLIGSGRGDPLRNTTIKAIDGFEAGGAIVQLGDSGGASGSGGSFGTRLEDLAVDCNHIPGVVGVYSESINEQSGLHNVLVYNFGIAGPAPAHAPSEGVLIDGTHVQSDNNIAQDYVLDQLELIADDHAASTAIGLHVKGGNSGPQQISTITAIGNSEARSVALIQLDNVIHGSFSNIHVEQFIDGISVYMSNALNLTNISGNNGTNLIHIGEGSRSISILDATTRGTVTNSILDSQNRITLTDSQLSMYDVGDGHNAPIITDSESGFVRAKRITAGAGTPLTVSDFALSASWGVHAKVSDVIGTDQAFAFAIIAGTDDLGLDPIVTVKFHDGAWPTRSAGDWLSPIFIVARNDRVLPYGAPPLTWQETATELTITFGGMPVSRGKYLFRCVALGR